MKRIKGLFILDDWGKTLFMFYVVMALLIALVVVAALAVSGVI
jgi:hypothetical protein